MPLLPLPQKNEANPYNGYTLNALTGNSIQPIILESGDSLISGIPIPVTGKVIHPDSVSMPINVPANPPDSIYNAYDNVYKVPTNLTVIPVNHNSLTTILLDEIAQKDTLHHLINSLGDTIKTGVTIPSNAKKIKTTQAQPTAALPPRFKDDAINNMQYLDVDQGMASSYVKSILEDKRGNLWFGTYGGGVSMYNGKTFTHFTEKEGLSNNSVLSIVEDKSGNLWFGTYGGGVSMYNGKTFTHFTEKEGLSNNSVLSIVEDKSGKLWFGTDGGGVSMYNGKTFTHFTEKEGLSNNSVLSIVEDKSGNFWFGTDGGGVSMYNGKTFTHFTEKEGLSNNSVLSIVEDKSGNLWFGTDGGGVSMYNGETFTHFTEKEGLSNNSVLSIVEDKSGKLWFGTSGGGVSMYNGETFTHFTEKEGLSNNSVLSIVEDKSGNLWLGTSGGGVSIYNGKTFTHFTEKEGLSNNSVLSIVEDKSGNLWFGTSGGGVSMYNGETFTHFTEKEGLSNNSVLSILEDKSGNLWFGTSGGGVSMYNGKTFTHFTEKEGLSNNTVFSILEDKSGNLWFGTYGGGVSMYNGKTFTHFTEKEGLSNNSVLSIVEDKSGNLWFGTYGGGASMYNGKTFTHFTEKEGLSNNSVLSILEDKSGNLWFGTSGGGASMYNGKTFTHFTEKEGLSNNSVLSILEDKSGHIWMSTESGLTNFIYVISAVSKTKKVSYTLNLFKKNDGLKGMDFFANSVCLDSKNRIWWGSGKSLTMLDLNKFGSSTKPPAVYLRQIDINEQFIDYRNITDSLGNEIVFNGVQRFENYPLNLELPYDKNHLTFHFAAIDWSASHKIQYSFIMEGLNTTWSQPSLEAKADYRNLPYGTYSFKVLAIGESGEWSEPFEYTFTIHPPWWYASWALTMYALGALLLVFVFVRWRTDKLKKRQKELEIEVDNATYEIREQKEEVERQKAYVDKAYGELEKKNTEILDSINYAKRIQSAILPPTKLVKQYLDQSFILYKPKDIVAGDFYWMEPSEGRVLFAAADCTGHGVPGAMVSVVCNNGLNRSVRENGLTDPGEILNKTREIVIQEFEKSEEDVKDGMDISLCALHGNKLQWAGANNPIWIIRNEELLETKPNKQAIGKVDNPMPYTTHEFTLEQGDSIYIFTDGFQDQFGGEKGKKFKPANFKKLLLSIQQESMNKQHEIINEAFENWMGDLEQLDDVCVIGVKIELK
ncbi:two-component regulator propeller domain-containing protein [Vicingus serpentipes]|uniref:two-component regulator propeller domain-containing protein n=1 Tax=Vicingus serpentipes TaxID=1926625 RepID=UPI001476B97E|nr:two-component regulator propeller domain-containing protein [Vicingus serpentipes]